MSEPVVIGDTTLYLGDCREILPMLGAGAVVSDPPYGIGYVRGQKLKTGLYNGKRGIERQNKHAGVPVIGDDCPFDPRPLLRFEEVLLWGADHFYPRLPDSGRFLAWNKLGDHEPWDSFADVEFAWHSGEGAARIFSMLWKGLAVDRSRGDIGVRDHPTQKPVALMAWCIQQMRGNGPVIDPYMGSGTTGVACARLGRPFIGIEIEERYFDIAVKRIEEASAQPDMLIESRKAAIQEQMEL